MLVSSSRFLAEIHKRILELTQIHRPNSRVSETQLERHNSSHRDCVADRHGPQNDLPLIGIELCRSCPAQSSLKSTVSPKCNRTPTCSRRHRPNGVAQRADSLAELAALQLLNRRQKRPHRHLAGRDQVRGGELSAARGQQQSPRLAIHTYLSLWN